MQSQYFCAAQGLPSYAIIMKALVGAVGSARGMMMRCACLQWRQGKCFRGPTMAQLACGDGCSTNDDVLTAVLLLGHYGERGGLHSALRSPSLGQTVVHDAFC